MTHSAEGLGNYDIAEQDRFLPLNTVDPGGSTYLKVVARQGTAIHLAPWTTGVGSSPRPAVATNWRASPGRKSGFESFNPELVALAMWTTRTMCGLVWSQMATYAAEIDLSLADLSGPPTGHVCSLCAEGALAPR